MVDNTFDNLQSIDLKEDKQSDKIIAIRKLVRSLELRLRGYEWDSNGDSFTPRGNVLIGEELIQKATGLLQPFCEEANLICIKEKKVMARQKYDTCMTFLDSCLIDMGCPDYNYKVIFRMFKETLQNMADIIFSSRTYMEEIYGRSKVKDDLNDSLAI